MSSIPLSSSLARLFSGVTKVEFRREMALVLRHLVKKYPTFVDPCAGGLEMIDTAVQAGYRPADVLAGDINPFTHALASFVTGVPFKKLGVKIEHEFWDTIRERTGAEDYAEFLLAVKCLQLREHLAYEKQYLDDFLARAPYYAGKLKERLKGIRYVAQDMRSTLLDKLHDPRALVYVNPPAYRHGYTKMFELRGAVHVKTLPQAEEFDWSKEFKPLEKKTLEAKAFVVLYRVNELDPDERPRAIFVKVLKTGEKQDSLLANRPAEVPAALRRVSLKRDPALKPLNAKIFDGELRPDSTIDFLVAKRENGLYYRNLWAHRLGDTDTECFIIWTIDGQIFATCGLHFQKIKLLISTRVFESFGFATPHPVYPNLCRLLMMCLTSAATHKRLFMRLKALRASPLIRCEGIKTTCLSRYRKVKLNNGILDVTHREKLPESDMYRIIYEAKFRPDQYSDCIRRYLQECQNRQQPSES
jgi:hypothetical protein